MMCNRKSNSTKAVHLPVNTSCHKHRNKKELKGFCRSGRFMSVMVHFLSQVFIVEQETFFLNIYQLVFYSFTTFRFLFEDLKLKSLP